MFRPRTGNTLLLAAEGQLVLTAKSVPEWEEEGMGEEGMIEPGKKGVTVLAAKVIPEWEGEGINELATWGVLELAADGTVNGWQATPLKKTTLDSPLQAVAGELFIAVQTLVSEPDGWHTSFSGDGSTISSLNCS